MILSKIIVFLFLISPLFLIFWIKYSSLKTKNKLFIKFNETRTNDVSFDFFLKLINYEESLILMGWTAKTGYQRDGDELIENKDRSSSLRIKDHFSLNKNTGTIITSEGYKFKKTDNAIEFVSLLAKEMGDGTLAFIINDYWFIISKQDKNINYSADKRSFLEKGFLNGSI